MLGETDTDFSKTRVRWSPALGTTFEEMGLQNVRKDEFVADDYVLMLDQMNYLNLFQELIGRMPVDVKEELGGLYAKAVVEARQGVAWKVRRYAFVGQKP